METKCDYTSTCIYGSHDACDYIGIVKKSRVKDDPKGEIKNGKCGYYKEGVNARTRLRAKDRWDCAWTGRPLPEVD